MDTKKVFAFGKELKPLSEIVNKDESKEHFRGVVVRKTGYVETTDTKMLLRVPMDEIDAGDLPESLHVDELTEDIWLGVENLKKAFRSLNPKVVLDILKHVFISNGKDVSLVTTDLVSVSEAKENIETAKRNLVAYPETDKVLILEPEKIIFSIVFSTSLLKKLISSLDDMAEKGKGEVTMLFTGKNSAVHFLYDVARDKKGIGVVMPVRHEEDTNAVEEYNKILLASKGSTPEKVSEQAEENKQTFQTEEQKEPEPQLI
jgi:hypothetical protein